MPSIFVFAFIYISLCRITLAILQKPCQGNFRKFQRSGKNSLAVLKKQRWILKISKWQHKLARYYKRGKLVSYFLNNAAKTRLYGLKISEDIEIGYFFQSRVFFHLTIFTQVASAPLKHSKIKKKKTSPKSKSLQLVNKKVIWTKLWARSRMLVAHRPP